MTLPTESIFDLLKADSQSIDWNELLVEILAAFDCTTGTIHTLDKTTNLLNLKASQGIPEFLLPKVAVIPVGKGMAGIAAERREAVRLRPGVPQPPRRRRAVPAGRRLGSVRRRDD